MTQNLSDQLLAQLSEFVARHIGLHFPQERWRDLERGVQSAAHELRAPNMTACAQWLLSEPLTRKQIEILAGNLTVGETYFFREKRSFAILGDSILPELIGARQKTERRLRLWSAGCCTGEEPYSLAILLDRILPNLQRWRVTILGTDVNPHFLQKAAEGVFSEWAFRDAPLVEGTLFYAGRLPSVCNSTPHQENGDLYLPQLGGRRLSLVFHQYGNDGSDFLPQRVDVFRARPSAESRTQLPPLVNRGRVV